MRLLLFCVAFLSFLVSIQSGSFLVCPTVSADVAGVCEDSCSGDAECTDGGQKCCSNGCGHVCVTASAVPYYPPPRQCPEISDDMVGACVIACDNDSDCGDRLCCSNGCGGRDCSDGVSPSPLCPAVLEQVNSRPLIGAYVPQCEKDGRFSAVQCHGSTGYCWCVDPETGQPTTAQFERGVQPQCGDTTTPPPPPAVSESLYLSCPPLEKDIAGACSEDCSEDGECSSGQKCCSNGCGHSCTLPVTIPYIAPPTTCPDHDLLPKLCDIDSCESTGCSGEMLCCENSCGFTMCVESVPHPTPCQAIGEGSNVTLFGAYQPQCTDEGMFSAVQCRSHYCWCVDPVSGRPESDMVEAGSRDQLPCGGCVQYGQHYDEGESMPSPRVDSCERCVCERGEPACAENQCASCVFEGKAYKHQEPTSDDCGACYCLNGHLACPEVDCGDDSDDSELLRSWQSGLIGLSGVTVLLIVVAMVLFIGVVCVMRRNQFRHSKLHESESFSTAFEAEPDVAFKDGGNDTEMVELKVPLNEEPVKA